MSEEVGKGEDALEESGADCEARKAITTGGDHRPGPSGGCPACIKIAGMDLTSYERDRYTEAWNAWHRQSMVSAVPLSVVIWHWSQEQRLK